MEQKWSNQIRDSRKAHKHIQWNKCLARVSLGMYSATSSLSSPSQQYPIKLASFLCLNFPTPHASSYDNNNNNNNPIHKSHIKIKKPYKEKDLIS
jgi:hypothetical protein